LNIYLHLKMKGAAMNLRNHLYLILIFAITGANIIVAQDKPDWEGGVPEGCTTITVGRLASDDGSVMTSHTDDSHRTRSWLDVVPAMDHPEGSMTMMKRRVPFDSLAMPTYRHENLGEIPCINTEYRNMIGRS
ncbi:hypothetical protein ACFLTH_15165, partial [Bacteroidota bacterium]